MQDKQVAGFFIEMVLIIAILGTLSAVAIPSLLNSNSDGSNGVKMTVDTTSGVVTPTDSPGATGEPGGEGSCPESIMDFLLRLVKAFFPFIPDFSLIPEDAP